MLHLANVCLYTAGIDDEMLELALADKIRQTVADFIDSNKDEIDMIQAVLAERDAAIAQLTQALAYWLPGQQPFADQRDDRFCAQHVREWDKARAVLAKHSKEPKP